MERIEGFQIDDIDGCEFVYSKNVGHLLISYDHDIDGFVTGKILVVYADGSSTAISDTVAQKKIDNSEWIVYRPLGHQPTE